MNAGADRSAPPFRQPETARTRTSSVVWIAVGAIVVADQLTKVWAVHSLADGPVDLIGRTVQFSLTRNSGAAFSRFQGYTPLLALLAIGITVVLVRTLARTSDRVVVWALALVLSGALGNLVDRIVRSPGFLRGHVIDFVKVGSFPVFNVADSAITIGAVLLGFAALTKRV